MTAKNPNTVPTRLEKAYSHLPVGVASWLYNIQRTARLLVPTSRYPLADPANTLTCQPLIFVSAGRSGTTLLRSMLVMGQQIAIPPEGFAIPYAALQYQAMQEQSWYNLTRLIVSLFEAPAHFSTWDMNMQPLYSATRSLPKDERSLARILDIIYAHYGRMHFPQATMWGDQSIENARRLRWVMAVFPDAKYLSILRDGRDVVASYMEMGRGFHWAMDRWHSSVQAARYAQQHLPSTNFLEIRYEDLTTDPSTVLRQISSFAGIDYNEAMLDYWQSETTEKDQKVHPNLGKPLFQSSVGRWKERISPEQADEMKAHLGPMLAELGYPT